MLRELDGRIEESLPSRTYYVGIPGNARIVFPKEQRPASSFGINTSTCTSISFFSDFEVTCPVYTYIFSRIKSNDANSNGASSSRACKALNSNQIALFFDKIIGTSFLVHFCFGTCTWESFWIQICLPGSLFAPPPTLLVASIEFFVILRLAISIIAGLLHFPAVSEHILIFSVCTSPTHHPNQI